MLSAQGARDKAELAKRYAALSAFVEGNALALPQFSRGALKTDLDEWAAYRDETILENDGTKLQEFEIQLTNLEKEAEKYGFKPAGELHQHGAVEDVVGSAAAAAVDEAERQLEKDLGDAGRKAREAIPWWAWPAGLAALGIAGYAGLEIAKAAAYNTPAAMAMRAIRGESDDETIEIIRRRQRR